MNAAGPADAVVIGGGVIGAATLHALTIRGHRRTVLLEQGRFGAGATGRSAAIIRVHHDDSVLSDLAAESFARWLRFEEETGASCGYVGAGAIHLQPVTCVERARAEVARLAAAGVAMELLAPEEGARRFPAFSWDGVGGGVHEPAAGWADPLLATCGWIRRAETRGAVALEGVRVHQIIVRGDRVAGVQTSQGIIEAPLVVVAAGAWTPGLVRALGIDLGIRTKRIQMARLRSDVRALPALVDETTDLYGRRESDDSILLGLPLDEWDVDPDADMPFDEATARRVAARVAERLPGLGAAASDGGVSGFDGYTADLRGIVQKVPSVDGLFVAAGFSGGGFKIAPAVARRVADMVLA